MTTIAELRAQLAAQGYQRFGSSSQLSLHIHPLFNQPIVLVGDDSAGAREYQESVVDTALKRR